MTNLIKRLISMGLLLLVALTMILGAHVETQAARLWLPWSNGQAAEVVLGQPDFVSGIPGTTASLAFNPYHVAVDPTSGKIFIADRQNHRVLRFSAGATSGAAAEAVLGQADFTSGTSNRGGTVMANTLSFPSRVFVDPAGRLWVADSNNNRVLRFDNAAAKANGAAADGVLGQADFTTDTAAVPSQSSIGSPAGLFVDSGGRLWVAAENERRVLRFDNAAAKANGANAEGVLGQANFTNSSAATSQNGLDAPTDVHIDAAGRLWVADSFNQRVLRFDNAATKADGANADGVLGQTDFTTNTPGTSQSKFMFTDGSFFVGVGITTDAEGRLYVGDRFNNRIMIFNDAATKANGGNADNVLGQTDFTTSTANTGGRSATSLNAPTGVFFDTSGKPALGR